MKVVSQPQDTADARESIRMMSMEAARVPMAATAWLLVRLEINRPMAITAAPSRNIPSRLPQKDIQSISVKAPSTSIYTTLMARART